MASYQYVYVMKDLIKAFPGGREVFRGITLAFLPGVKIGVLGVNGAGKSTLLKIMAGLDTDYGGEAWAAEGARVGYLEQEPQLDAEKTVGENVEMAFAELKAAMDRFNEISMKFAEPMSDDEMNTLLSEQADLQAKIDTEDGWDLDRRVDIALDALRCPPADATIATLSGGERRRVALCRLLLEKPDLLLLDEPTNHLDAESVAWLEHTLHDYAGTVMVVWPPLSATGSAGAMAPAFRSLIIWSCDSFASSPSLLNACRTASKTSSGKRIRFSRLPPYSSSRWFESGERNWCRR